VIRQASPAFDVPWEFTMIQTPKVVYILYEFTRVWRSIAMDREHPKDRTLLVGDSIGRYEGDTLVIRHDRFE